MAGTLAAIFCFSLVLNIVAQIDLNDALISAWTFDDGTADDTIADNDGEINGATITDGKFFKAFDFNGVDAFVRIPHDESMEAIADGMAVSAWVYIRTFPQPNHAAIVFKGTKIGWSRDYAFRIATRDENELTWAVTIPDDEGNFSTPDVVNANEWTFLCLTADGAILRAYVAADGADVKEVDNRIQPGPYQTRPGEPIEIGVGRARDAVIGNDIFFDGIIDEFYLWSRALSMNEVAELAAGRRPTNISIFVEPLDKLATSWGSIKQWSMLNRFI